MVTMCRPRVRPPEQRASPHAKHQETARRTSLAEAAAPLRPRAGSPLKEPPWLCEAPHCSKRGYKPVAERQLAQFAIFFLAGYGLQTGSASPDITNHSAKDYARRNLTFTIASARTEKRSDRYTTTRTATQRHRSESPKLLTQGLTDQCGNSCQRVSRPGLESQAGIPARTRSPVQSATREKTQLRAPACEHRLGNIESPRMPAQREPQ